MYSPIIILRSLKNIMKHKQSYNKHRNYFQIESSFPEQAYKSCQGKCKQCIGIDHCSLPKTSTIPPCPPGKYNVKIDYSKNQNRNKKPFHFIIKKWNSNKGKCHDGCIKQPTFTVTEEPFNNPGIFKKESFIVVGVIDPGTCNSFPVD